MQNAKQNARRNIDQHFSAGKAWPKLLSVAADAKTIKGQKKGYLTGVMYLAPGMISGFNLCPGATPGCLDCCLGWFAGRVNIITAGETTNAIQISRILKSHLFMLQRVEYMKRLVKEIEALIRKAERENFIPVVRLNGSSDIPWENIPVGDYANLMEMFPHIQFYDYTKRANRRDLPSNYYLVFSLAETRQNELDAWQALDDGLSVAAVFGDGLPDVFMGRKVVNGDETDLIFTYPPNSIIGLNAKGEAKKDESGFVKWLAENRAFDLAA